jgi:hypothetical protein
MSNGVSYILQQSRAARKLQSGMMTVRIPSSGTVLATQSASSATLEFLTNDIMLVQVIEAPIDFGHTQAGTYQHSGLRLASGTKRELFLCGSNLRLPIGRLHPALGKQRLNGHTYEGQTLIYAVDGSGKIVYQGCDKLSRDLLAPHPRLGRGRERTFRRNHDARRGTL